MSYNHLLRSASYCLSAAVLLAVATSVGALAAPPAKKAPRAPLVIEENGARTFDGKVIGDPNTASLHCDHGYVEWWFPQNKGHKKLPLLMWHSSTTKTWENTFANDEGFKNIFLRRGFPVYMIDAPRIGRAAGGCEPFSYTPNIGSDQSRITSFRLGIWIPPAPPQFYPGVQFPVNDPRALAELYRASVPEFNAPPLTVGLPNVQLQSDAVAELLEEIGPTVLLTHSGSGIRGWWTAIKSDKVKGIVSYEPSACVYPQGEVPPPILRADGVLVPVDAPLASAIPLADFVKLTKIPIQIVVGDNIPKELDPINVGPRLSLDNRRINTLRCQIFVDAVNRHGGNAQLVALPEIGIFGNTHFMMSDLNNQVIAGLLADWLSQHGLDKQ